MKYSFCSITFLSLLEMTFQNTTDQVMRLLTKGNRERTQEPTKVKQFIDLFIVFDNTKSSKQIHKHSRAFCYVYTIA